MERFWLHVITFVINPIFQALNFNTTFYQLTIEEPGDNFALGKNFSSEEWCSSQDFGRFESMVS